jgi:hypothetical protein
VVAQVREKGSDVQRPTISLHLYIRETVAQPRHAALFSHILDPQSHP